MAARRRIAVVGGGIAGLTLGAALDPRLFEVTIHEATPDRDAVGSALGLWPAARRALTGLGVLESLETGSPGPGGLHHIGGRRIAGGGAPGLVMVRRPDLVRALGAALPPAVRRVTAEITDPASLDADLVVGADGVRSVVRGLVDPRAATRRQTDYVVLRGLTDSPPPPGAVGEYWGGGVLFGVVPVGEGSYWFSAHRSALGPEPLGVEAVLHEARARAESVGAARVVRDTLAAPQAKAASATRLWVAPPLRRYARGRYVVLGDAAHAMTPNLGRGACDAIVDAVTLARALTRGGPWARRSWQTRRVPLTQLARAGSGALMRLALDVPVGAPDGASAAWPATSAGLDYPVGPAATSEPAGPATSGGPARSATSAGPAGLAGSAGGPGEAPDQRAPR